MKKVLSLLVILLFVVSIAPALAEESTGTATSNVMAADAVPKDTNSELTATSVSDEDKMEKTTDVARVTTTSATPVNEQKRKELLEQRKEIAKDVRENVKEGKKDMLEQRKEMAKDVRENVKEVRKDMLEQRKEMLKQKEGFAKLNEEEMQKISALKEGNTDKLGELRPEQIKKLTEVKAERLRNMASHLDEQQLSKIADLDKRQIEKLSLLDRERMKEYSKLTPEKLKEKLNNLQIKKVDTRLGFMNREVNKEELNSAMKRYEDSKEEYKDIKANFNAEKQEFMKAREKGDEKATLEHAKKYLLNSADLIITTLEKIKEKAKSNGDLTEAELNEITSNVDALIKEIEDAKSTIEAAQTKEELKNAGKVIAKAWEKVKENTKRHTAKIEQANVGEILQRSEQLEKKLDNVIAAMEEKGINVANIDVKVDLFSKRIEEARNKFELSKELFEKGKASQDSTLIQQSRAYAKEAHSALKEAHNILKEIIKDVRNAGGSVEDIESTEAEDVEVIEAAEVEDVEQEQTEDAAATTVDTADATSADSTAATA